jgi:hypothetical protein
VGDIVENFEDSNELSEQEKKAIVLYTHVKEIALFKYEAELRREDSLIQQSSQMQTAFSFMSAAVFMVTPVIIQYRGVLSLEFFLMAISSVIFFLLISLVTASAAQFRKKHEGLPDINVLENHVNDNWETTLTTSQQLKQFVELFGKVQSSKARGNDSRVLLIRISMWSFMASILDIAVWYIIAINIMC